MLRLAFRNIFRNRTRSGLTLAAIACGVAAIIVSGGFVEDVFVRLREATIHSQLGHLQIYRHGYLEFGRRDPFRYVIDDPQRLLAEVKQVPHVTIATTRVYFSALGGNGRADLPIAGEGVQPDEEARLGTATVFVAGRALQASDPTGATVGEGVAHALKLDVGSPLNVTVSTRSGALNALEFKVVGIFRTFSKDYDEHVVRITRPTAQELLNTDAVHAIVVGLDDTANTDEVLSALQARLAKAGDDVKPWYELADFYKKTVDLYRREFGALQLVILVLLVLSVASTVNMVVYERTGEFGTLLALGTRRTSLFRLIVVENALLGLIGAALGTVLGIAAGSLLSAVGISMPPPPGSSAGYTATIRLTAVPVVVAAAIGGLAAVIAALLPGRRASRLPVVEALRHNV